MKVKIEYFVLVAFLFICCGCGTIVIHTTQDVGISSNPSDAIATVGDVQVKTPGHVTLKKNKAPYTVRVEKEGYEEASATIEKKVSGWIWGNILFGGIIGAVIDFASGGAYKLVPDDINVDLKKKSALPAPEGTESEAPAPGM